MVNCVGEDAYGDRRRSTTRGPRRRRDVRACACPAPRAWPRSGSTPRDEPDHVPPNERYRRAGRRGRRGDRADVVVGQFETPQATTAAVFAAARRRRIAVLNPAPAAADRPGRVAVTDWLVRNEQEFGLIAGKALTGSHGEDVAAVRALAGRY